MNNTVLKAVADDVSLCYSAVDMMMMLMLMMVIGSAAQFSPQENLPKQNMFILAKLHNMWETFTNFLFIFISDV